MKKIRVLLVEDNRLLREGIAATLNAQPDFTVVAMSTGNRDVRLKVQTARPDVVLIDLGLRSQNGLTVISLLKKEFPGIRMIGLSLMPAQMDILKLVQAGASGFLMKDASVKDFLNTIRTVAGGQKVLPPPMTTSLFSLVVEHALAKGKVPTGAIRMTKREREVIALIAEGHSNKEIARELHIATYTVKSHVHNILEKLALHSRLQIATYTRNEETSAT